MLTGRRLKGWVGMSAAMLLILRVPMAHANPQDLELAIEATYLARLPHFVTWPQGVFSNTAAPVVICIQGADPFGTLLDRLVEDHRVGERPIAVRRLARLEPRSGCHLAYLGGSPAQSAAQALEAVEDAPVITVTDERRGPAPHGVLHFFQDGPRLRFAVDIDQVEQTGVAVSSKLLALAVGVKR